VLSVPRDVGNTPRDEHEEHADAAEPGSAVSAEPQFRVHLFGDVKFSAIDSTRARNGFALGQFDLFGQSQLSDRLSVLTEATLTALPRNTFNARLERLLVTYWASDRFIAPRAATRERRLLQHGVSSRQLVPDRGGTSAGLRAGRRHRSAAYAHPGRLGQRRHPVGWAWSSVHRGAGQRPRGPVVGRDGAAAGARR
jgi:hypothetical protein